MKPTEQIELVMLHTMVDQTPSEYLYGYYFPFKYFERSSGMDRETVRGFLRSMRSRGLVQYGCGMNDDGEVAGGGYTLVPAGMVHYRNLKEQMRNEQIAFKRRVSPAGIAADAASWAGTSYG